MATFQENIEKIRGGEITGVNMRAAIADAISQAAQEAGSNIEALVESCKHAVNAYVGNCRSQIEALYDQFIDDLDGTNGKFNTYVTNMKGIVYADNGYMAQSQAALDQYLEDVGDALDQYKQDVNNAIAAYYGGIEQLVAQYKADVRQMIDGYKGSMYQAIAGFDSDMTTSITNFQNATNNAIATYTTNINNTISGFDTRLAAMRTIVEQQAFYAETEALSEPDNYRLIFHL